MEAWLRLANLQLPPRTANALLDRFGAPEALFAATGMALEERADLTDKQAARLQDPSFIPTRAQLDYLHKAQVCVLPRDAADYPRMLRDIPDPPPVLFVRGTLEEKDRFAVALVGSRQASPYGRAMTARLARDLAHAGMTVVSGGALGIDTAAHFATVEAGGRTLVVLGCGLDVDYPRENQRLFERVVAEEKGALMTEFPLGATPEPWRFPMRNRIISGLAMGVVVVEAGAQSGALLTASIAAEQGREVMAVPGNVDRAGSKGTYISGLSLLHGSDLDDIPGCSDVYVEDNRGAVIGVADCIREIRPELHLTRKTCFLQGICYKLGIRQNIQSLPWG